MHADGLDVDFESGMGPFGPWRCTMDDVGGRRLIVVRTNLGPAPDRGAGDSLDGLVQATRRLSRSYGHGLVQIRSVRTVDEGIEVTFEAPDGATLHDWLDAGDHPRDEVVRVARSLIAAIAEAHTLDVPHRSLSARDIFVAPDRVVTVTGFGLTRLNASPAEASAPEIAAGEPATLATDQFNLGRILARLATNAQPRLDLEPVIRTACAARPADRFGDLFDLAAAFENAVQAETSGPERESVAIGSTFPRFKERRRWLVGAISLSVAVAACAAAISLWPRLDSPTNQTTGPDLSDHAVQPQHGTADLAERASELLARGELAQARPLLEAALTEAAPHERAPLLVLLGTVDLKTGALDQAIASLRTATELDPRADSYFRLALALAAAGQMDAAREAIDAGLLLEPDHPGLLEARSRLGG